MYWINEAAEYLGLDRLGLTDPTRPILRMVKRKVLPNRKIAGRLVFTQYELDQIVMRGDHKPRRGRPPKMKLR